MVTAVWFSESFSCAHVWLANSSAATAACVNVCDYAINSLPCIYKLIYRPSIDWIGYSGGLCMSHVKQTARVQVTRRLFYMTSPVKSCIGNIHAKK